MRRYLSAAIIGIVGILAIVTVIQLPMIKENLPTSRDRLGQPFDDALRQDTMADYSDWNKPIMPGTWPMVGCNSGQTRYADVSVGFSPKLLTARHIYTDRLLSVYVSAVVSNDNRIVLFNGNDLEIRYPDGSIQYSSYLARPLGQLALASPTIIGNGDLFFLSWENRISIDRFEFNPSEVSRTEIWRERKQRREFVRGAVYSVSGLIYWLTSSKLCAYTEEGILEWEYVTEEDTYLHSSTPAVNSNSEVYINTRSKHGSKTIALDENGNPSVVKDLQHTVSSHPIAIDSAGRVFVTCEDGWLVCLNSSGDVIWDRQVVKIQSEEKRTQDPTILFLNAEGIHSPIVDESGNLFVLSTKGDLVGLSVDGNVLWEVVLDRTVHANGFISSNGLIVIVSDDGCMSAHYAKDGRQAWSIELEPTKIWSNSPVCNSKGDCIVVSPTGTMYIVSTND